MIEDEFLTIDEKVTSDPLFVDAYLGPIVGVAFFKRGLNDGELLFKILSEDDEYYFLSNDQSWHTYWCQAIENTLKEAREYAKKHFEELPTGGFRVIENE